MLEIQNLYVTYGGLTALSGVNITVREGEFVSIIGPNGAGKTTLFKSISGSVTPQRGTIRFKEEDLTSIEPWKRPHLGIAHVPEGRQMFPSLTVMENLEMGACTASGQRDWIRNKDYIFTLFPMLQEQKNRFAGTLSGGQQQMLAIGRALASSPTLIMLDEPSMGLAPAVVDAIFECIVEMRRQLGLTILLVEQRAAEALQNSDRGYVLETGRVVLEGSQASLIADDRVRQAYLGI